MINWQLNTTKAPFNDVDVRKALSMAVDREQVTKIGMSGYAKPADCTGLSGNYETWKNSAVKDNCTWTNHDVEKANELLDKAGYPKGADGKRTMKDGKPFEFEISVGATSSDWLSVANVIAQNLAEVGVTARWSPRIGLPWLPAMRPATSTPALSGAPTTPPARTSTSTRQWAQQQ